MINLPVLDATSGAWWERGKLAVMFGLPEQTGASTWDAAKWDVDPWGGEVGWVDVTCWARGVNLTRGRSSELESFNVATCSVELWNEEQRFSPWNLRGPYMGPTYSNLRPGMPVAIALGTTIDLYDTPGGWDGFTYWDPVYPPTTVGHVNVTMATAGQIMFSLVAGYGSHDVWVSRDGVTVFYDTMTNTDPDFPPVLIWEVDFPGTYVVGAAWVENFAGQSAEGPPTYLGMKVTPDTWDGTIVWHWFFVGTVESIRDDWPGTVDQRAVFNMIDTMADLATVTLAPLEVPAHAGDTTGERIDRVLDMAEWRWTRDLAIGATSVRATALGKLAIDEVRLTADTEGGAVWADKSGALVFNDLNFHPPEPGYRFSDDCSRGHPYYDAVMATDTDLLVNVALVGAEGDTPSMARNAESVRVHGIYDYSRLDLINESTNQAQRLADTLVERRAFLTTRVDGFSVDTRTDPGLFDTLVRLELRDVITLERAIPNPVRTMTFRLMVEGIQHNITPDVWQATFTTSPALVAGELVPPIYGEEGWDVGRWDETAWSDVA